MILIIDNYDSFTWNLYQYLCELTPEEVRVVRNDRISLEEVEALAPSRLVLSPGPGRPEEAGITRVTVRTSVVLPEPLGPSTAQCSPRRMVQVRERRATISP